MIAVVPQLTDTLPESRERHRPDIQGLRALAVLTVMIFHSGLPMPGGFLGVDVFFVISGFVITAMLMREQARSGRVSLRTFYLRRFKRLGPALVAVMTFTVLASAFFLSPLGSQQTTALTAVAALFLASNFWIALGSGNYFDPAAGINGLLNLWSLSVEEQFYLVFPLVLIAGWALARKLGRTWLLPVVVAVVGLASFALAMYGVAIHADDSFSTWLAGFYSPLTRSWEFALGSLLAIAAPVLQKRWNAKLGLVAGVLGAVMVGASLWLVTGATPWPGPLTVLPVVGSGLLLVAGLDGGANAVTRMLSTTPMVKLGDWSYSLYLWHWPLVVFASVVWPHNMWATVGAVVVSFGPALASYRWVETPMRNMEIPKGQVSSVIIRTILPVAASCALLVVGAANGFWLPGMAARMTASTEMPVARLQNCDLTKPLTDELLERCMWNKDGGNPPVYLLGDSNADQFSGAVTMAGKDLSRPVVALTARGCPFLDIYFSSPKPMAQPVEKCREYSRGTLEYLDSAKPGLVIISNSDIYWGDEWLRAGLTLDQKATDQREKDGIFHAALQRTVERLQKAGHQVMIVKPIPLWKYSNDFTPARCPMVVLATGGCYKVITRAQAESYQGPYREIVDQVAASTGASTFDTWAYLCSDVCSTVDGDRFIYRDGNHITAEQSRRMAPDFTAAIGKVTLPGHPD